MSCLTARRRPPLRANTPTGFWRVPACFEVVLSDVKKAHRRKAQVNRVWASQHAERSCITSGLSVSVSLLGGCRGFQTWPVCQETSFSVAGAHEKHKVSALVFSEETLQSAHFLASPHRLEWAATQPRMKACAWQKRRRVTHPPLGFETYPCSGTDAVRD